jgi:hypothetical protein
MEMMQLTNMAHWLANERGSETGTWASGGTMRTPRDQGWDCQHGPRRRSQHQGHARIRGYDQAGPHLGGLVMALRKGKRSWAGLRGSWAETEEIRPRRRENLFFFFLLFLFQAFNSYFKFKHDLTLNFKHHSNVNPNPNFMFTIIYIIIIIIIIIIYLPLTI